MWYEVNTYVVEEERQRRLGKYNLIHIFIVVEGQNVCVNDVDLNCFSKLVLLFQGMEEFFLYIGCIIFKNFATNFFVNFYSSKNLINF